MKKIILATTAIVLAFTACKKSKVEEPTAAPAPTHLGLWKGKFSISTTTQPSFPVFALLTQNGEVKIYNGADTATAIKSLGGIWIITGTRIILQYKMPNTATDNFILFVSDDTFTKSIAGSNDFWGNGSIVPNNWTPVGLVSFTKP